MINANLQLNPGVVWVTLNNLPTLPKVGDRIQLQQEGETLLTATVISVGGEVFYGKEDSPDNYDFVKSAWDVLVKKTE